VHTFFLLAALLVAGLLAALGSFVLRLTPLGGRRHVAFTVLISPVIVLGVATAHVIPLFWMQCSPLVGWDRWATIGILSVLGIVGLGALALNMSRLILVERLLAACRPALGHHYPGLADLCARRAVSTASVRLLASDAPMAFAGGLRRPAIVLSTWLLEQLDRSELEAVFTHELAHLSRRDYLSRWLARLLRDATVYLPSAWYALQVLEAEEELQADAWAVRITRRPLAMASALGKVWRAAVETPRSFGLAALPNYNNGSQALLEQRLERLLNNAETPRGSLAGRLLAGAGILSLGGLTPRLLLISAIALPLVCTARPH